MKTLPDYPFREILVGRWQLDPHRSSVEFRTGTFWGLMTVRGHFDHYQGQLDLRAEPALELTIDAGSVQTGNRKRDEHLRSTSMPSSARPTGNSRSRQPRALRTANWG